MIILIIESTRFIFGANVIPKSNFKSHTIRGNQKTKKAGIGREKRITFTEFTGR